MFYEAILKRDYFNSARSSSSSRKDLNVRFKELRFYARFLLVSLILCRFDMVKVIMDRFQDSLHDSKSTFPDTEFKEWKLVAQEIGRFVKADTAFMNVRPLRYCIAFDAHEDSLPYVARFHAKKMFKFQDALLTSYHRNEVKFAELSLDTFRMLQCLEWEPSGAFHKKRPVQPYQNGTMNDYSGTSGLIDMNLAMDMTDPSLPQNPRKAVLYRPSVAHLTAVIATICEELPADSIFFIYISASGNTGHSNLSQTDSSGGSRKSSKKAYSESSHEDSIPEAYVADNKDSLYPNSGYISLAPTGNGGPNNLYPGDIIPFTRRPLFFIIDSDNSHAFKVLHGSERGEAAALLLSPLRPMFKNLSSTNTRNGSQFTFFLTAPVLAFYQLVGHSFSDSDIDVYNEAEKILSTAFSAWEVILCTSTTLDLVWAQVLSDPFIRRIILRFIFCRSVLFLARSPEHGDQYLPICFPHLPSPVSPTAEAVQSAVVHLAKHLRVSNLFRFSISFETASE